MKQGFNAMSMYQEQKEVALWKSENRQRGL